MSALAPLLVLGAPDWSAPKAKRFIAAASSLKRLVRRDLHPRPVDEGKRIASATPLVMPPMCGTVVASMKRSVPRTATE